MRGKSWAACAVGVGLVLAGARSGVAQGLYPPAPGSELERLSRRMAEAVRDLGEDLSARAAQAPAGPFLARDAQELSRATGDWYASLRGNTDPYQVRRSYSGIDAAWHRLRAQLASPGASGPEMADEIARVEQVDTQIHQALQLNGYPPNFDGAAAPPSGLDETRRLAYALAQRGEALAATVQSEYAANPAAGKVINDTNELARAVDAFYDRLGDPAFAQQQGAAPVEFSRIVAMANGLGPQLGALGMPPRVSAAWDGYATLHNTVRTNLGLTAQTSNGLPDPNPAAAVVPYAANPTPPIGQWADELDREVDELLANFAPTAPVVPEGRLMLDEMARLRDDTRRFRAEAAQGFDAGRLAFRFRDVDADCHRLSRHFARIGRGRTGPNIQRVQQISQTCEQIHRALGMPGYPPSFGPYEDVR